MQLPAGRPSTGRDVGRLLPAVVLAVVLVAVATAVKLWAVEVIGYQKPFLIYFTAVIVTAWYGGMIPGVLATVGAAAAARYFFIQPVHSLGYGTAGEAVPMAVFVIEGLLISAVCGGLHAARWRAEDSRHHLAETGRQYRRVVENVDHLAVFGLSPDGTVTSWNPGAERLFGWAEGEIVGRPVAALFTPDDRAAGVDAKERDDASRHGHATDDRDHLRRDGSRFPARGVLLRVDDDRGRPAGFTNVVRDMTA